MNDTGMAAHTSLRGETSEVFWNSFLVLTGNSLGGCRSWSCRKWKKGQRRLFFILFFSFLLLLQSCLSFPSSFDSFLPFSEKTTLSDANALHVGGFLSLSNRCCCRRRRLYGLKRSGAYMSSALLSVDLCPSLSSSSWIQQRQPQTSHSAVCECLCRRELIDFGARAHWKAPPPFSPSWTRLKKNAIPLYRMSYI